MKKIIILSLLAVLAFVTACTNNDDSAERVASGNTGRYVEENITPFASEHFITLLNNDGSLVAFDAGMHTRFDSVDGVGDWVQSQGPGHGNRTFEDVTAASFMEDGSLLVFLPGEGLAVIGEDGSHSHFPFTPIDDAFDAGNRVEVSVLQILENGQLLIGYNIITPSIFDILGIDLNDANLNAIAGNMGIDLNNLDLGAIVGNLDHAMSGEIVGGFGASRQIEGGSRTAGGGQVAEFRSDSMGNLVILNQPVFIYDIATGLQLDEVAMPRGASANEAGDFYTYQSHTLLRHGSNGDVDLLLDGAAFAFSAQGSMVSQILVMDDDSIVVVIESGGQTYIYRYYWDENATIDPNKILTIWSLHDNATVRAAISEIWRRNPDAYIVYEVALGDGGITASDAIRTLNTRLLANSGPDIIILDGVPIESYAGRGMLMDLSAVDTADVYQNLLAPFTAPNGNLYAIPTQLLMPVLIGEEDALSQISNLADLVESVVNGNPHVGLAGRRGGMFGTVAAEDRSQLAFDSVEELFNIMWLTSAPGFIVDNQLDIANLTEFLAAVLAISDMYNLTEPSQDPIMSMVRVVSHGPTGGMGMPTITGSLMQYMMQTTNLAAFPVDNFMVLQAVMERNYTDMTLFPGLTPGAWQPSTIASISADTGVADFATEFINTLLSIQVQHINHGEGLPVTRTGVEEQIASINEILEAMDVYVDITTFDIINYLHAPSILEESLRAMIWGTVDRLTVGAVNLEGAVNEIEQNVRNYLAERG